MVKTNQKTQPPHPQQKKKNPQKQTYPEILIIMISDSYFYMVKLFYHNV